MDFREFAKKLLVFDGNITSDEARLLRRAISEDSKVEHDEVEFLAELRHEARAVDPAFDQFFFHLAKRRVLHDGSIDDSEAKWLHGVVFADGGASAEEVAFVDELKSEAKSGGPEFDKLCQDCENYREIAVEKPKPPRPRGLIRKPFDQPLPAPKTAPASEPIHFLYPIGLLALGLILMAVGSVKFGGSMMFLKTATATAVASLIATPITIVCMYLLAAILGISYGLLGQAVLKLLAINFFVSGVVFAGVAYGYPVAPFMIMLPVTWWLFSSLFDLDVLETFYSVVGLMLLQCAFGQLLTRAMTWIQG